MAHRSYHLSPFDPIALRWVREQMTDQQAEQFSLEVVAIAKRHNVVDADGAARLVDELLEALRAWYVSLTLSADGNWQLQMAESARAWTGELDPDDLGSTDDLRRELKEDRRTLAV